MGGGGLQVRRWVRRSMLVGNDQSAAGCLGHAEGNSAWAAAQRPHGTQAQPSPCPLRLLPTYILLPPYGYLPNPPPPSTPYTPPCYPPPTEHPLPPLTPPSLASLLPRPMDRPQAASTCSSTSPRSAGPSSTPSRCPPHPAAPRWCTATCARWETGHSACTTWPQRLHRVCGKSSVEGVFRPSIGGYM